MKLDKRGAGEPYLLFRDAGKVAFIRAARVWVKIFIFKVSSDLDLGGPCGGFGDVRLPVLSLSSC